jgi:serine protease Do
MLHNDFMEKQRNRIKLIKNYYERSKKMAKKRIYFGAVALVAIALFVFVAMGVRPSTDQSSQQAAPAQTVVIKDEGGFSNAISTVAEAMRPTVVHIDITGTVTQQVPVSPFGDNPFFRQFFGPPQGREQKVPIRALGSGVIISKDGYIITNNHVVANADTIEVELYDKTKQKAKLIGADPSTDLAVIKIDPTPTMKYAQLGDSDKIKVGQWVIAIGSPRGFDWTVTAGIVSAQHRTGIGALGPTGYEDFIQTDASINPGNSGGPLIGLNGKVIGINSLIVSASRGSEGMGFAIPSNMARDISESLIKNGKVVRGFMGVNIQDITPDMAKSLKLKEQTKGAIVTDVVPEGPADKAGIEQGDIVTKFDGKSIQDVTQLRNLVAATNPGSVVKVTILRNNKEMELSLTVGDLSKAQKEMQKQVGNKVLGVTVKKVTPQIAKEMGLNRAIGVIITAVAPESAAARVGLQNGDIIFRVGNVEVNDPGEFSKLMSQAAKEGGALLLIRDVKSGNVGYITVPLK